MEIAVLPDLPDPAPTTRQRRILQFVEESKQRNGYVPSHREIGEAVGLASPSSVTYQLRKLAKLGLVTLGAGRSRAIMLTAAEYRSIRDNVYPLPQSTAVDGIAQVPLVGRIAAGRPIFATEMVEDVIPLPRQLIGEGDFITLRVAGDSMIGAAIADGDLVVVRKNSDVEIGDIVAAMIGSETSDEGEATVKKFQKRDGHVWLDPQNPSFEPIPGDTAEIIGRVVAVLRRL